MLKISIQREHEESYSLIKVEDLCQSCGKLIGTYIGETFTYSVVNYHLCATDWGLEGHDFPKGQGITGSINLDFIESDFLKSLGGSSGGRNE